jgi:hypothetical protein
MTKKSKRIVFWTILGGAMLLAGAGTGGWWLVRAAPRYWTTVNAGDPEIRQRAAAVESFVSTQTTHVRPDMERWSIELTQDQVNAWLATRLPMWLANQGVEQSVIEFVPSVLVHVGDEKVEFAAELKLNGKTQIVQFVYRAADGEGPEPVRLTLEGVYAGRLPLPVDWTIEQIKQRLSARGREAADQLRSLLESIDLVLKLDDGRMVKVVDMALRDGKAILTCQTDLRRTADAAFRAH